MKRTAWLAFAFLFCSVAISAQNESQSQKQLKFVIPVPLSSSCPVGMHARHEDGLHRRVLVNGATPAETPGLHLVLTLTDVRPTRITNATVTVHGLNGKKHLLQTGTAHDGSGEVTKQLNLVFAAGEEKSASTDLVVPGFTSVSSIVLDSLTYTNGSTWKFSGRETCQVAPDGFMLVDAQMAH